VGPQFKICFLLVGKNWRINTSGRCTVHSIDYVVQGTGKPTMGENEISKRQFNLMPVISAIVKHPIAAVPIYIPNMEYPICGDNRATLIRYSPFWTSTMTCIYDVF
jgi:hypothetical protein